MGNSVAQGRSLPGGGSDQQPPSRFLLGVRRLRPVSRTLAPQWDLALVLRALSKAPFEPLDQVPLKVLSAKVALLLALTSAKRVSDLSALSVSCLRIQGDGSSAVLSVEDICTAASWSSPCSFIQFYLRDVSHSSLTHPVLSVLSE